MKRLEINEVNRSDPLENLIRRNGKVRLLEETQLTEIIAEICNQ